MSKHYLVFLLFTFFGACVNRNQNENENTTIQNSIDTSSVNQSLPLDSVEAITALKPLNNISALVNGKQFTSISYTINRFVLKKDTVYALYSTNGTDRIIINYRGPAAEGVYNIVESGDAVFMDSLNTLFNAKEGVVAFDKFDVKNKVVSGWFYFTAHSQDKNKKPVSITNGKLKDATFFTSQ
ncbi:MAG TPA: hypothetical protein PKN75_03975 [Bacteroidia bacterium]|nr:hypothetical protein [Bacteroidia bacterium]HNU32728.1 hypothetical protein [Bacteroidia bacterium]